MSFPSDGPDANPTTPYEAEDNLGPRLIVLADEQVRTVSLPERGELVIGRGTNADIQIDASSLSRRHAVLRLGDGMTIEDVGSSNGTRIGKTVLEPHRPVEVAQGELIELGDVAVIVQSRTGARRQPRDDRMATLHNLVDRVARSEISVLILGETGAGKEVLARRIHESSPRRAGPFLPLNCAALSEPLLESELFGHESGAFTGARQTKEGLLETANGGTVFLDEIGELPAAAQVKLLRVLEERQVLRVGGLSPRDIDVRFVAATHRNLRDEVANGRFRQDLFFRLNGIALVVPPLRERLAELPGLAQTFIEESAAKLGVAPPQLSAQAVERLLRHSWPGNVRELKNVVERAVVLCSEDVLSPEHLLFEDHTSVAAHEPSDDERARLLRALQDCAGNQTRAAKMLGISRKTLGVKMDRYGIARPQKGRA